MVRHILMAGKSRREPVEWADAPFVRCLTQLTIKEIIPEREMRLQLYPHLIVRYPGLVFIHIHGRTYESEVHFDRFSPTGVLSIGKYGYAAYVYSRDKNTFWVGRHVGRVRVLYLVDDWDLRMRILHGKSSRGRPDTL